MIDRLNVVGNGSIKFVTEQEIESLVGSTDEEKLIYSNIVSGLGVKIIKIWGKEYTGLKLIDILAKLQVCLENSTEEGVVVALKIDIDIKDGESEYAKYVFNSIKGKNITIYLCTTEDNKHILA